MEDFLNLRSHTKTAILFFLIIIICVIFYLMKNFKTIDIQLKILLVFLFFGFSFAYTTASKKIKM